MKNYNINYLSVRVLKRFYSSLITKNELNIELLKKDNIPMYKRFLSNISYALINFYNTIAINNTLTTYKRFFNLVQKALLMLANTISFKHTNPVINQSIINNFLSYNTFISSIHTSFIKIEKQLNDPNIKPKLNKVLYRSFITSVLNAFNKLHNIQKAKSSVVKTKPAVKNKPAKPSAVKAKNKLAAKAKLSTNESEALKTLIQNNNLLLKQLEKSQN